MKIQSVHILHYISCQIQAAAPKVSLHAYLHSRPAHTASIVHQTNSLHTSKG